MLCATLSCFLLFVFCQRLRILLCGDTQENTNSCKSRTKSSNRKERGCIKLPRICKRLAAATAIMILTLCLICCTTMQPRVQKPSIPDPLNKDGTSRIKYDERTNTVTMDYDYFRQLFAIMVWVQNVP